MQPHRQRHLTKSADNVYTAETAPAKFAKAVTYLQKIESTSTSPNSLIENSAHEMMIHAIYGSNYIERAGLGLEVTTHLCRQILLGDCSTSAIDKADEQSAIELMEVDPTLKNKPIGHVLRGRQEIIQHIKAYRYFLHRFVTLGDDMTEALITDTHKILCQGVPVIQQGQIDVPPEAYGGIYRKVIVGAGNTNFVVPHHVPRKMAELCVDFKADMQQAEATGSVDPFSLAAKYSLEFVQIHPFLDGNGRMCRIILNAILFRFCGIFVAIGESEEDRTAYLDIKKRASQTMEGHGEYATFVLGRSVRALRRLKQKLNRRI
jgi:Fic family protein